MKVSGTIVGWWTISGNSWKCNYPEIVGYEMYPKIVGHETYPEISVNNNIRKANKQPFISAYFRKQSKMKVSGNSWIWNVSGNSWKCAISGNIWKCKYPEIAGHEMYPEISVNNNIRKSSKQQFASGYFRN